MTEKKVTITCSDNFPLSAVLFVPDETKAVVMLAPATGIKKGFYRSFATYLCEMGYVVITFENRGIGESKVGSINNGNPNLADWGRLDMTAVLEYLKSEFQGHQYHLIGHSAGGQLVGFMDNCHDLTSMFNFASSSGSLKYAEFPFRLKSAFYLTMFIPWSNLFFGQVNSQWVGMGEPLPKNVGKQWGKWCKGTGYVKVDLDTEIKEHHYYDLHLKSKWIYAQDDDIANSRTVQDMIRVYTKIESETVELNPKDLGMHDIGHMKFFSSKRKELWPMAVEWLESQS
ncbi:MAG: alpha/beta hydrolase [Flavobacteriales bacterium]|nr:alpha/beta hydrolase [Flavobacteriales bacterium]